MNDEAEWGRSIVGCIPHLRAFARMLVRDHALAEDMVQEALVRALAHRDRFEPGTNIRAWLTRILRNRCFNEFRSNNHRGEVSIDLAIAGDGQSGGQDERLEFRDLQRAFAQLPLSQREALILVAASGLSYEEAAQATGCAAGTMKSRVSRARQQLHELMDAKPAVQHSVPRSADPRARRQDRSQPGVSC